MRSPAGRAQVPSAKSLDRLPWRCKFKRFNEPNDHRIVRPQSTIREHEVARPTVRILKRRKRSKQRGGCRSQTDIDQAASVIASMGIRMVGCLEHPAVMPVHLHGGDGQRDAAARIYLFKCLVAES